jgi:hypothetical protein
MKKLSLIVAIVLVANLSLSILETHRATAWSTDSSANTPVCTAKWSQGALGLAMVDDGSGGAIIAWADSRRGGRGDIYAQRVDRKGESQWNKDGVAVCTESGDRYSVFMANDGAGGAIIAWMDLRAGPSIHAQRIDPTGHAQWAPGGSGRVCFLRLPEGHSHRWRRFRWRYSGLA